MNIPPRPLHPRYLTYMSRLNKLEHLTLQQRRIIVQVIFVAKVLGDSYNLHEIKSKITRHNPERSTRHSPYFTETLTTNIQDRSPRFKMIRAFNEFRTPNGEQPTIVPTH